MKKTSEMHEVMVGRVRFEELFNLLCKEGIPINKIETFMDAEGDIEDWALEAAEEKYGDMLFSGPVRITCAAEEADVEEAYKKILEAPLEKSPFSESYEEYLEDEIKELGY